MGKWRDRRPSDYDLPSTGEALEEIRKGTTRTNIRHVPPKDVSSSTVEQESGPTSTGFMDRIFETLALESRSLSNFR